MASYIPYLLEGALFTIQYAVISIILSTIFGFVFGILGALGPKYIKRIIYTVVVIVRAIPVLIHLFLIYYFLPTIGISIGIAEAVIIGLSTYFTTYNIESVRGAILALPRGQMEAGLALGLSKITAIRQIILPQSLKLAIPPLVNNWVTLVKGTSYASIVGLFEMTKAAQQTAVRTFAPLEVFGITLIFYFILCYAITRIGSYYEKKYSFS